MARRTTQWFLSLQLALCLLLIFVRGNEDSEDGYRNGRNLVLEYFLPINLPSAVDVPVRREKRDVEGSGEEDSVFSELKDKTIEDADNSTRNAKFILQGDTMEGSGEVEEISETPVVPLIGDSEVFTTTELDEGEHITEKSSNSSEMIFDRSEDYSEISTTEENITTVAVTTTTTDTETTTIKSLSEENTTESRENETTTPTIQETTTVRLQTTTITEETTTVHEETTTLPVTEEKTTTIVTEGIRTTTIVVESPKVTTSLPTTTTMLPEETTTTPPLIIPILIPKINTTVEAPPSTPKFQTSGIIPNVTEGLPVPEVLPTTPEPIVEETFKEIKIDNKVEALPGNILQKGNLSLAAETLLIANTRLMDSEENVQLSSSEPKRIGAYIVIGLILLSFSSLVGYITFKKRMNRKRQEFESNQESNDTEKALLSLSDYKDNADLEENHLKNNEITPIVVKSNSQINKFEKNTNFSSPKNLNTIANEKNIEKDNVLKSTTENLTQVIIEDSPKDQEEEKNAPSMEKLIVKTRIDQDSIPKKPIIINRSSTGYLPIPQDNS